MSLQWTFIAVFLYTEIALVILLLLPYISPTRWQKIFRSRLLQSFTAYANLYFSVFIIVLLLLFVDAIREVRKYSVPLEEVDARNNPNAEATIHMKLFRAQRNFYIVGFALFLWLVVRRLVTLLSRQATLLAEGEAARKQAQGATLAAQQMLEKKENKDNNDEVNAGELQEALEKTKTELHKTKKELESTKNNLDAMLSQAKATNKEYDRLLKEHEVLQRKLALQGGGDETKKDS